MECVVGFRQRWCGCGGGFGFGFDGGGCFVGMEVGDGFGEGGGDWFGFVFFVSCEDEE